MTPTAKTDQKTRSRSAAPLTEPLRVVVTNDEILADLMFGTGPDSRATTRRGD